MRISTATVSKCIAARSRRARRFGGVEGHLSLMICEVRTAGPDRGPSIALSSAMQEMILGHVRIQSTSSVNLKASEIQERLAFNCRTRDWSGARSLDCSAS